MFGRLSIVWPICLMSVLPPVFACENNFLPPKDQAATTAPQEINNTHDAHKTNTLRNDAEELAKFTALTQVAAQDKDFAEFIAGQVNAAATSNDLFQIFLEEDSWREFVTSHPAEFDPGQVKTWFPRYITAFNQIFFASLANRLAEQGLPWKLINLPAGQQTTKALSLTLDAQRPFSDAVIDALKNNPNFAAVASLIKDVYTYWQKNKITHAQLDLILADFDALLLANFPENLNFGSGWATETMRGTLAQTYRDQNQLLLPYVTFSGMLVQDYLLSNEYLRYIGLDRTWKIAPVSKQGGPDDQDANFTMTYLYLAALAEQTKLNIEREQEELATPENPLPDLVPEVSLAYDVFAKNLASIQDHLDGVAQALYKKSYDRAPYLRLKVQKQKLTPRLKTLAKLDSDYYYEFQLTYQVGPLNQQKPFVLTYPLFPTAQEQREIKALEEEFEGKELENKLKAWVSHKICYLKDGDDFALLKNLTTALQNKKANDFLAKWKAVRPYFPKHPVKVWNVPSSSKGRKIIL